MANQYTNPHEKTAFKIAIESQGFNVETLAKASGVGYYTVQRLAAGVYGPERMTLETALKLCRAMHLPLNNFVKALGL